MMLCVLLTAAAAHARQARTYQAGTLLQMDTVQCGTSEKEGRTLTGRILGTDSSTRKSRDLLCQEYVLETEPVIYTIRPRDEKHPVLLPVGEKAQFRLEKDKMLLRVEDLDDKEREYVVVSMTPRSDSERADAGHPRLNHLQ